MATDDDVVQKVIETTLTAMKRVFHKELRESVGKPPGHGPSPTFALVCAVHPMTGVRESNEMPIAVIVSAPTDEPFDDKAKDAMGLRLRMIALAGDAIAYVSVMDAWISFGAAAVTASHRGGKTAGLERVSVMIHAVEQVDRPSVISYTRYEPRGDDFEFHDSERFPVGAQGEGRFLGVLPEAEMRTPQRMAAVRKLLAAGAGTSFRGVG